MTFPAYPSRSLTEPEVEAYHRDGVIMVKGLLASNWLDLMESGVESARRKTSIIGRHMSRKTAGYQMDIFLWKRIDEIRDLIYYAPFARWAQQVLGSKEVRFFYDQMFVKEPGTDAPTPWHQDMTFWPVQGEQMCSFWIPLEPVTKANSGLQYVKGSHRWSNRFKAISPDYNATLLVDDQLEAIPDINAHPDKYDVDCWDMEPGDALIFHPLTLHGSSGNTTRDQQRRALALRWFGDDVTYHPSPSRMPLPFRHSSVVGGALQGAAFPRILPSHDREERAVRAGGPESANPAETIRALYRNVNAAVRLKFADFDVKQLEQTW